MADLLRARFPRAIIITGDAFELDETLHHHARHVNRIGAVFSSLPLRNFRAAVADNLAKKIRAVLPAGGRLVQYTYRIAGNRRPKAAASFPPRRLHTSSGSTSRLPASAFTANKSAKKRRLPSAIRRNPGLRPNSRCDFPGQPAIMTPNEALDY